MYRIILKPMVAYLDERNDAIEGGKQEAAEIEARITERAEEYDARLAQARQTVSGLRADRRAESQEAYDAQIALVRSDADTAISSALDEINAARAVAAATMKQNVDDLANAVAGRVLGRELAGS
jgi:F-type H+-transporting ATPase subunit b